MLPLLFCITKWDEHGEWFRYDRAWWHVGGLFPCHPCGPLHEWDES